MIGSVPDMTARAASAMRASFAFSASHLRYEESSAWICPSDLPLCFPKPISTDAGFDRSTCCSSCGISSAGVASKPASCITNPSGCRRAFDVARVCAIERSA
jgi:hypothetical protein